VRKNVNTDGIEDFANGSDFKDLVRNEIIGNGAAHDGEEPHRQVW
jgi:hypothetical protein